MKIRQRTAALLTGIRTLITLFFAVTPCQECLRGRIFFSAGVGALLSGGFWVAALSFAASFVFLGRKHQWWIK